MTPDPSSADALSSAPATTPDPEIAPALGPFIGRHDLVVTATEMLNGTVRWLTLHGPGGIGKTRLAAHIAAAWQGSSGGKAWIVNLEALTSNSGAFHERLYSLLAEAVGLPHNRAITAEVVREHFQGLELPEVLLIFDRCDDILAALRPLLEDLLTTIPRLRIIATSREKFRRKAEQVLTVTPLAPHESVALFNALAKRAGASDSALADKSAVTNLCRELDGLPLAVQLAAGWVPRGISVEDLTKLLQEDRFSLLSEPSQQATSDAPEHSGLELVVSFSFGRCSFEEQDAWKLLSVFRHGFDLPSAAAVTGRTGMAIRMLIAELVDKSVIDPDPTTHTTRWRMSDTVQEYGLRQLGPAGIAHARRRHCSHFAALAEHAASGWSGPHEIDVMHALRRQLSDVLAAIDYRLAEGDVMAAALIAFNVVRSRTPHFCGDIEIVAQVLRRVIGAFGTPDTDEQAVLLATVSAALGWVVVTQGRADEAAAMAQFAKDQLARRQLPVPAPLLYPLGAIEALRNGSRVAIGLLSAALLAIPSAPETAGDRRMIMMVLSMITSWADVPEHALVIAAEHLREAEACGGPWSIAWALWCNALAARNAGRLDQARQHIFACLRLEQEINDRWGVTWSIQLYAEILAAMLDTKEDAHADAELAAWLLGAASALRTAMGVDLGGLGPLAASRDEAEERIRRSLTSVAGYARPYEAGRRRSMDAISVALGESTPRRSASATVTAEAGTQLRLKSLTKQELKIALLLAEGLSNAEIAAQLMSSPQTVKKHVSRILAKLDVRSRAAVARRVVETRAIAP